MSKARAIRQAKPIIQKMLYQEGTCSSVVIPPPPTTTSPTIHAVEIGVLTFEPRIILINNIADISISTWYNKDINTTQFIMVKSSSGEARASLTYFASDWWVRKSGTRLRVYDQGTYKWIAIA